MGGFKTDAFTPSHPTKQSQKPPESQKLSTSNPQTPLGTVVQRAMASSKARRLAQTLMLSVDDGLKQLIAGVRGDRAASLSQSFWQWFVVDTQPQVKWWRDAQGHGHYSVYDPHTRRTQHFDTAREVRVWLEQRYYQ